MFIVEYLLNGMFPCQSDVVRLIRSKKREWKFSDKFEYRMLLAGTNTGGSLNSQTLLKKHELEDLGYKIARDRKDEMLTLWFRRKNFPDVNVLTQFWSKGRGKTLWKDGSKIGRFIRQEDWSKSFFIDQLFFENSDEISRPKILPQTRDAVEVEMEVELLPGELHIKAIK